MKSVSAVVALVILFAAAGRSQERPFVPWRDAGNAVELTGNARIDFAGELQLQDGPALGGQDTVIAGDVHHKSPWLAAGMSLILPGSGEFYSENYWRSAAFFAIEVAAWVVAYSYDKKGDNQTNFFQGYADQHWSVVRYAMYTQSNLSPPNGPYNWLKGTQDGQPPWDQVNWDELNRMERDIGGYYSHVLPPHGDQQYYELIGKYPQFNQGWDDANPNLSPPDYSTIVANITPHFTYYSDERGKANSYYNTASTFVSIAIINHVVSAIDAALTAHSYNKNLHAEVGLQRVPVEYGLVDVPVLKVHYTL